MLNSVDFVKFLVIDEILKREDVSLDLIDELKKRILGRDTDYFKDYPDFKEAILKLEEGKNVFRQWNKVFRILFYVWRKAPKRGPGGAHRRGVKSA